jgi:hypothetical protein
VESVLDLAVTLPTKTTPKASQPAASDEPPF